MVFLYLNMLEIRKRACYFTLSENGGNKFDLKCGLVNQGSLHFWKKLLSFFIWNTLHEKCPKKEFFSTPHSDWIRWDTPYFPCLNWIPRDTYLVRMPENVDKKKLRIWTLFEQWYLQNLHLRNLDQLGIKKRPFFWRKVYCKTQDHSSRVIVKN